MIKIVQKKEQPDDSIILNNLSGDIHYIDSYQMDIVNIEGYSIDYLTTLMFASDSPKWARLLANLRDFIVKPFGLETGIISEQKILDKSIRYKQGDMIDFFPVLNRSESEIVMAKEDKHLYFRVSVFVQNNRNSNKQSISITTIVQFHNIWGKVYFTPVKPFHKIIVKSGLKRFFKQLNELSPQDN